MQSLIFVQAESVKNFNVMNYNVRYCYIQKQKNISIDNKKSIELALLSLQLRQDHLVPASDCIIMQVGKKVNYEKKKVLDKYIELRYSRYNEVRCIEM